MRRKCREIVPLSDLLLGLLVSPTLLSHRINILLRFCRLRSNADPMILLLGYSQDRATSHHLPTAVPVHPCISDQKLSTTRSPSIDRHLLTVNESHCRLAIGPHLNTWKLE